VLLFTLPDDEIIFNNDNNDKINNSNEIIMMNCPWFSDFQLKVSSCS
jgi:hypothetical protein